MLLLTSAILLILIILQAVSLLRSTGSLGQCAFRVPRLFFNRLRQAQLVLVLVDVDRCLRVLLLVLAILLLTYHLYANFLTLFPREFDLGIALKAGRVRGEITGEYRLFIF